MNTVIDILTYCHECQKVFIGQHLNCPACGSGAVLMCDPGPTIRNWIEAEGKAEKAQVEHCGCCDQIFR